MLMTIQRERTPLHVKKSAPHHRPFFFLTKKKGFSTLEIVPDGGVGFNFGQRRESRMRVSGRKSPDHPNMILVQLPLGKEILVFPEKASRFVVQNSNSSNDELTFDLGFALSGPKAYNIEVHSEVFERLNTSNNDME